MSGCQVRVGRADGFWPDRRSLDRCAVPRSMPIWWGAARRFVFGRPGAGGHFVSRLWSFGRLQFAPTISFGGMLAALSTLTQN